MATFDMRGNYKMDIKIGSRTFLDLVELSSVNGLPIGPDFDGKVVGTLEVVGIFKSALSGQAKCYKSQKLCEIEFSIIAKENGKEEEYTYRARLEGDNYKNVSENGQPAVLTGSAFSNEGRDVFGKFIAIQQR